MIRSDLEAQDLAKPHWGNHAANLVFLRRTGLLDTPRRILEIGSAKGYLLRALHNQGHHVVGIDMNRELVAESKRLVSPERLIVGSGTALPFQAGTFDIVMSFDVFEHIPESDTHISEVSRVLAPSGYYLLQTPNKWTNMLFEPIRFGRKYGIRRMFSFLEYPEHCALHGYWQLMRRFTVNGFDVTYYDVPVVNDFFRDKIRRFLGTPGLLALHVANPDRLPVPLRTNFFVQARKLH